MDVSDRTRKLLQMAKIKEEHHILKTNTNHTSVTTTFKKPVAVVTPSPIRRTVSPNRQMPSRAVRNLTNELEDSNSSDGGAIGGASSSSSDYIPPSESESDEEFVGKKLMLNRFLRSLPHASHNQPHSKSVPETSGRVEKANILQIAVPPENTSETHALENTQQTVQNSVILEAQEDLEVNQDLYFKPSRKINNKRIRDKDHACYFCSKLVRNIARHLEQKHENESEVSKILAMPKKSKRRREAFSNLIRCGDFHHNVEVLTLKSGELILSRRPTEQEFRNTTYNDYGPCPQCLGFMIKKHLWHHLKYGCVAKRDEVLKGEDRKHGTHISESNAILNGILGNKINSEFTSRIVNQFRDDEVARICKDDSLIIRYGAFLFEKYNDSQSELIRQSMRQLARLLIELKKHLSISSLSDALEPEKFDAIIIATKVLCEETKERMKRSEFKTPSLALKVGYALKKCIGIKRGEVLRNGDMIKNDRLLALSTLIELEWNTRISSNALATLHNRKINATELLPVTDDLLKLAKFLEAEMTETSAKLKSFCNIVNWSKLASLTLSRLILFNKRRSGEASKMTMSQYSNRPSWESQNTSELKQSLSDFEIKLASSLQIVYIIGKRGRKVPVILTPEMKNAIDLLINTRKETNVDIPKGNIFVFATKTENGHIRGYDALRKWCIEAEISNPSLITSTKLRKYVATVSQIFNLTENEYDWLARHLGHDVRVHREFYRLQENAVELIKVSRILLAVDQGEAHKFKGKALRDIHIEELPYLKEHEDDDEEDDPQEIKQGENTKEGNENLIEYGCIGKAEAPKRKVQKGRATLKWTTEEKAAVLKFFKLDIKNGRLPGKMKCEECITKNPVLKERKWTHIKFCVKNHISKIKKFI